MALARHNPVHETLVHQIHVDALYMLTFTHEISDEASNRTTIAKIERNDFITHFLVFSLQFTVGLSGV